MILKNGLIIVNGELVKKDILIENGIIVKIDDKINGYDIIDCKDNFIMPGAIDVHVHLREPGYSHKETIESGTCASAKGGVTTVMSMPNLNPCPDNVEHLKVQLDLIKEKAMVDVYPYGAVTVSQKGELMADIKELSKYVKAITDDGVGVNNIPILKEACKLAKELDLVVASHAEDLVDSKLPQGEYVAVRREIEIAKEIGCKYHFCHMSTKESFDAIRKAQKEGYTNITCEVAPHHLVLNETMIKDANWKMNPPLRSEANRLATIEALLDGTATVIASDHAPHSVEEKSKEYDKCPNGILGLETMLPVVYTNFIKTGLATHQQFVDWFVNNPAKIFNLPVNKIEVGERANIAVLDIKTERVYTKEEIVSLSKNSPFIGFELTGYPVCTLVDGKVVYKYEA